MKTTIFRIFSFCIFVFVSISANAQNAGILDASFGSGGIVGTNLNAPPVSPSAKFDDLAIQSDNKIIVIGSNRVGRFNTNGTLDTTFDGDGVNTTITNCNPQAVIVQPDGKIVFGGIYTLQTSTHVCAGRLNSDGTLDSSFDNDGIVQITMGIESQVSSINILPNGKILVAGWTSLMTTFNRDYAMVKFNTDGSLDPTFGTGGRVATELGSNEFSYDSVIQPDGKIILVGDFTDTLSNQRMAAMVRYNSNGTVDTNFGNNGRVLRMTGANGKADDVELQTDGKIIIAGYALVPARYNSSGTLDIEFNTPSWATTSSVAIQSNGKIIIAGSDGIFLARYNSNGALDNSFGTAGIVTNTGGMSGNLVFLTKVEIAPDGKIVLGGTRSTSNFEIVLAQYLNNRATSMDFDGDSKTDISIFRPSNGQWWFLRSSDNSNYALQFGVSTDKIVPADYTGDGKTDVAVYRPSTGEWFILRSEDFSFYAFPFGISTDTPVPADYDGDSKADAAVFRASSGTWYINNSTTGNTQITNFGINGDRPVQADYDGDGKADIAIYRPTGGTASWWIRRSSNDSNFTVFTPSASAPVIVGDFTGDGKSDFSYFIGGNTSWNLVRSEDLLTVSTQFGQPGDILTPGDYDGDGKFDLATFRPANNTWNIRRSSDGATVQQTFGTTGDLPTPNVNVR